ncbi:uncharacterized protein LOC131945163 isoform X2 [Physella acuta]|uniref:uncharacterized protein LOC131945163 isoform X2 n=1 Tax=Physella acuta TaxID=109671 RepID=UPI0027DCC1DE|nr:uncharacterized protein LOC131945163 isoform X2 [Physella acuta]
MEIGLSVNMRDFTFVTKQKNDPILTHKQLNQVLAEFAVVESLQSLSDILSISPEYILKVKAKIIKDDLVTACIESLSRKLSISLIFKVQMLLQQIATASDEANVPSMDMHTEPSQRVTHFIQAYKIGNELICIVTLVFNDAKDLEKFKKKKKFITLSNEREIIKAEKALKDVSKLIRKKEKKNKLKVTKVFSGFSLPFPTASFGDILNIMQEYTILFSEFLHKQNPENNVEYCNTKLIPEKESQQEADTAVEESEHTTTLATNALNVPKAIVDPQLYIVRACLQPVQDGTDTKVYSADSISKMEHLFSSETYYLTSAHKLEEYLENKEFSHERRLQIEGKELLDKIRKDSDTTEEIIKQLDFINYLERSDNILLCTNPLEKVTAFLEDLTTTIPGGKHLDLILMGKTGHGKSATGNCILNEKRFPTSTDTTSQTVDIQVEKAEIDGRLIRIVDTPGIWDTNINYKKLLAHKESHEVDNEINDEALELVAKTFAEAVAKFQKGFHAFLLIYRFNEKMTKENIQAIQFLKEVLGKDVIKYYGICIITFGDNFKTSEDAVKGSFDDWLKRQTKYAKQLFEECNYRCVLFDNSTKDEKIKKLQVIKLVSLIDELSKGGERTYDKKIFQEAQEKRMAIIKNKIIPKVDKQKIKKIRKDLEKYKPGNTKHQGEVQRLINEASSLIETDFKPNDPRIEPLIFSSLTLFEDIELHSRNGDNSGEDKPVITQDKDELEKEVAGEIQKTIRRKCFPGEVFVLTENMEHKPMNKLKVGERVLTMNLSGLLTYEKVFMFGHRDPLCKSEFITLKTEAHVISVSPDHFVYCRVIDEELFLPAREIQLGYSLLTVTDNGVVASLVTEILVEKKEGLFAPFTTSGTIVVNGLVMSCYVDVFRHNVCHNLLAPVRLLYRVSPRALAFVNGSSADCLVPPWVLLALKFLE